MDGNISLPDVPSLRLLCTNAWLPCIISVAPGLPANVCVMWLILAKPADEAADVFSLNQAVCEVCQMLCF